MTNEQHAALIETLGEISNHLEMLIMVVAFAAFFIIVFKD